MKLEGSLTAFNLPETLQFLSKGNLTGFFHVTSGEYSITLHIKDGAIINSSSFSSGHKLGQFFVERGVLKRSDLDKALRIQKEKSTNTPLGEILVAQELLGKSDVEDTLKLQLEEDLWDLFSWDSGDFKFDHRPPSDLEVEVVNINIDTLITQRALRAEEWNTIVKTIPNSDVVFGVVSKVKKSKLSGEVLSRNDWKVLALINGMCNVLSVVNRSGLGKFETYRVLNKLLASQIIQPKDENAIKLDLVAQFDKSKPLEPEKSESDDISMADQEKRAGFLKSFLGHKRRASDKPLDFISPVGLVSSFIQALSAISHGSEEPNTTGETGGSLFGLWRKILPTYPIADLIRVTDDQVISDRFERFFAYFEQGKLSESFKPCYEETIEALGGLLNSLFESMRQRSGDKDATKTVLDCIEKKFHDYSLRFEQGFDLQSFVTKRMEKSERNKGVR